MADGSGADASAGGLGSDTGANDDTAIDIGNNTGLFDDGAFAGNADLDGGLGGGTGSGDTAIDIGNNTGTVDGSFAGAGGLVEGSGNGDGDTSIDVGDNTGGYGGPWAVDGNDNYAGVFGDDTGDEGAVAGTGNGNIAEVVGLNNYADAIEGNNNIAYVFDPFGAVGSEANAGYEGSSDLAAVFGDDLYSTYTQAGSDLYDILTPSGDFPGSVGPFLAELLSLF